MSIFSPLRTRRSVAAALAVSGSIKFSQVLLEAQQNVGVNIRQVGSQNVSFMPYICDNSTGIQSTVFVNNSTSTQLISSGVVTSSVSVYICGWNWTTGGSSGSIRFTEGTSSNCETGEAAKTGTFTFSSHSGMVVSNAGAPQFKGSSGASICLETGSSATFAGIATFVTST